MGKRSDFERIEKDFYRTFDTRAGDALRPFLAKRHSPSTRYAEPFAGAGDLINQFPDLNWTVKSDIDPQIDGIVEADAFEVSLSGVDCVLTNPPWSRSILHKAIVHFSERVQDTWLLFDAAWAFTGQASDLIERYCLEIVPVGRLKWIPGTTMSGKDDCAWYRFSAEKKRYLPTRFHPLRRSR